VVDEDDVVDVLAPLDEADELAAVALEEGTSCPFVQLY